MSEKPVKRLNILVFDSGLGGLSIIGELQAININADIYHVADTRFFPYGEKTDATLIKRVPNVVVAATKACEADLVIVACNTASTIALPALRAILNIPIIGVVPAIKPAAALTKTGVIGLLATPGTVKRPYTDALINDFAADKLVLRHGGVGLAGEGESKLISDKVNMDVIQASIDGLFQQARGQDIDVIVLACTHYPLLIAELKALAPRPVLWVDSGVAIAKRACDLLNLKDFVGACQLVTGFTTGGDDAGSQRGLKAWGFADVKQLAVDPDN